MRLEEAAVQKGNGPEGANAARPGSGRAIERSEEERIEQVPLQRSAARQAFVHRPAQEVIATVEPPSALHEIEEQHTGKLEKAEGAPVRGIPELVTGNGIGRESDDGTELAEELVPDPLTLERFSRPCRKCCGRARRECGHPAQ